MNKEQLLLTLIQIAYVNGNVDTMNGNELNSADYAKQFKEDNKELIDKIIKP